MDVRLFEAVMNGEIDNLRCVLDCGGKLSVKDNKGSNLLHAAVASKQLACARYLIEVAPQLAGEKNGAGRTPLLSACQPILGLDIIKILVQDNDCLEIPDDDSGRTPLHYVASDYEGLEATKFLLDCGANINALDRKQMSVLHLAIRSNNIETVKLLLERDANVSVQDFMQVDVRRSWGILQLLLQHQPSGVNTMYPDGYSLLMRISKFGEIDQVKTLLDLGADCNVISENSTTALMEAVRSDDPDIVKLLLDAGADPLVEDKKGRTILSLACKCEYSSKEMLKLLFNLEQFKNSSFQFNSPEVHPQTIVLRKKRSSKLLKFIIESDFKNKNLVVHEDFMNMNLFKIFDSDNMALGPISYTLHNPESHLISDDTTIKLLELLVEANYPVDTHPNSIPPLTILLSCDHQEIADIDKFMKITRYLINNGAHVNDMSLKIVTTKDGWPIVENLRQETRLPDALLMAFLSHNVPAIELLLPHWSAPPLALLLMDKEITYSEVISLYETLAQHGLPLGTQICKQLTELLQYMANRTTQRNPAVYKCWTHFKKLISVPPSLRDLAKFATRAAFSERSLSSGCDLLGELQAVCPPGLKSLLLMQDEQGASGNTEGPSTVCSPTKVCSKRRKL